MKRCEKNKRKSIIDDDIDLGRFFETATTSKKYVNSLNLHEIKNEILEDNAGDFELIRSMLIGEIEQKINVMFKNVDEFETSIDAIDISGYESDVVIFTGWLFKLNTPEFDKVNRCQNGEGTYFKQDIVEDTGNNCYVLTSGNCFIKCNNRLTGKDYTDFLTFILTQPRN